MAPAAERLAGYAPRPGALAARKTAYVVGRRSSVERAGESFEFAPWPETVLILLESTTRWKLQRAATASEATTRPW
jgi:hypothetical protein